MVANKESISDFTTRQQTFKIGRRTGETIKTSTPKEAEFNVANLLVNFLRESEDTSSFPLAQGLWHGFNYALPISIVRSLSKEELV